MAFKVISGKKFSEKVVHGKSDTLFQKKEPSVWRLWQHGVTSSFVGLFMTCTMQTYLHYVKGWQSKKVAFPLEFGTCGHYVLEQAYSSVIKSGGRTMPYTPQEIEQTISEYHEKWLAQVEMPTEGQLQQQENVYAIQQPLLESYMHRWDGDFLGQYSFANQAAKIHRWDSLEENFCVPYTYPDGKVTYVRGKRDGVFQSKDELTWVFDSKFRSRIGFDDERTLPFDFQQMLYLWATHEEMKKRKGKYKFPAGTIMNIVRRPALRQKTNESDADFVERIRADVEDQDRYDHYYFRYQHRVGYKEILLWKEKTLDPVMKSVRLWWEGVTPTYLNPSALNGKYGRCGLFDPLVGGDFSQCYQRSVPFNELGEL